MGDIVKKVKLCGLAFEGDVLVPVHAQRQWPEVKALVDTGSTSSVITTVLAELAGAKILRGSKTFRDGVRDGAMMVIHLPGCKPSYHHVVVDDELAASAEPLAFMILGHDYLQAHRARIDYDNGELVTCPPRLPSKPSKPSKRKLGNGRRRNGT